MVHTFLWGALPTIYMASLQADTLFPSAGGFNSGGFFGIIGIVLSSSGDGSDLLLLTALPALLSASLASKGAFWWAGNRQAVKLGSTLCVALSAIVLVPLLEHRVIFRSYAHLIHLPYPANYVVVTVVLYAASAIIILHTALSDVVGGGEGELGLGLRGGGGGKVSLFSKAILYSMACAVATLTPIALGMHLLMTPVCTIAAAFLVRFYLHRSFTDYLCFVVCTSLCSTWFISRTFWFLNIQFAHVSMHTLSFGLLMTVVAALMLPGLLISGASSQKGGGARVDFGWGGAIMILLAALTAICEGILHWGTGYITNRGVTVYPAAFVLYTSAMLIYISRSCLRRVGNVSSWTVESIAFAKISLLMPPPGGADTVSDTFRHPQCYSKTPCPFPLSSIDRSSGDGPPHHCAADNVHADPLTTASHC
jgi:hypothetical protein